MSDLIFEISTFVTFLHQQNHIDYSTFTFLDPSNNSRVPIFYLLPKIHKPGVPDACLYQDVIHLLATSLNTLTIISNQLLSKFHLIYRTQRIFCVKSKILTFGVKSLYTNIPHDEGLNVCISALQSFYGNDFPLSVKH